MQWIRSKTGVCAAAVLILPVMLMWACSQNPAPGAGWGEFCDPFKKPCREGLLCRGNLCVQPDGDVDLPEFSDDEENEVDEREEVADRDIDADPDSEEQDSEPIAEEEPEWAAQLQPGEQRVTTGESGFFSSFINYDVDDDTAVYCTRDYRLYICSLSGKQCSTEDFPESVFDCACPVLDGTSLAAMAVRDIPGEQTSFEIMLMDTSTKERTYPLKNVGLTFDFHNGKIAHDSSGMRIYDLDTQTTIKRFDVPSNADDDYPYISGSFLTWQRNLDYPISHIMLYDISSDTLDYITSGVSQFNCHPAISDSWVVWIEDCVRSSNLHPKGELKARNLITKETITVDPHPHEKDFPDIYEDKVVWTDFRNGGRDDDGYYVNTDIYLYDLTKQEGRAISTAEGLQFWPRIHKRWVIYADQRWGRSVDDIVAFDLCTLDLYEHDPMCREN